jgi:hypothetical protein
MLKLITKKQKKSPYAIVLHQNTINRRRKMRKYSLEWKKEKRKWIEKHTKLNGEVYWSIHYMQYDTEYLNGEFYSEESALEALKNYNV